MATRESQGLQIALILFVMVTVALAVTTYVYFRKSEEKINEAQAAQTARANAEKERDVALFKVQALKYMVGGGNVNEVDLEADLTNLKGGMPADQELQELEAAFKQDMALFGADFDQKRNYQVLPSYLLGVIRDKNAQLAEASQRVKTLIEEKQAVEKRERERADQAVAALQQANADKDKLQTELVEHRNRINDEKDSIASQLSERDERYKTLVASSKQKEEQLQKSFEEQEKLATGLRTQLRENTKETFEVPDGKVNWVNPRANSVWINLGSSHGLQPQMSFSVYDREVSGMDPGDKKGSIEVTKILDQYLAEARIVDSHLRDPILPGDVIYTPSWQPGRRLRFALAGLLDVTGDGKSDRELVQNLISMNGGDIDAEVLDNGNLSGKMTVDTRYLVVGDRPTDKTAERGGADALAGYTNIITEAEQLGVTQISLSRFLSLMGWKGEARTVPIGKDSGVDAAGGFKERRPPARGRNGAY